MEVVVFDIETVPVEDSDLSEEDWDYLLKFATTEEEEEKQREKLSFWPFTAHLVSVALYKPQEKRAVVLYIADKDGSEELKEGDVNVFLKSYSMERGIEEAERRILGIFWEKAKEKADHRFVSFNGRRFDSVFLMLRSFILGVKATRNLLDNRFRYDNHIDLLDLLTFHGQGRRYTLDFVCRRLGIPSPKGEIDGAKVKEYFRSGRYREIALYNLRDAIVTGEIYKRFLNTLGDVLGLSGEPL
jgi:predicted PolB exonuclease-like 3'-5' exonuclease